MNTLITSTGLNSYVIEGCSVQDIVFYRAGAVIFRVGRGWIEDIRPGCDKPRMIRLRDLRRSMKPDLTKGGHFWTGSRAKGCTLYIDAELGDYTVGPAVEHLMWANEESQNFITVHEVSGPFKSDEPATYLQSVAGTARTAHSQYGAKIKRLEEKLGDYREACGAKTLVERPDLMLLAVEAAVESGKLAATPAVKAAMQQLAAALASSRASA